MHLQFCLWPAPNISLYSARLMMSACLLGVHGFALFYFGVKETGRKLAHQEVGG